MSWAPYVTTDGKSFATNSLRFATKEEAWASATELSGRWMAVQGTDAREHKDEPVNYVFNFDIGANISLAAAKVIAGLK